jgi:hypothetical protein
MPPDTLASLIGAALCLSALLLGTLLLRTLRAGRRPPRADPTARAAAPAKAPRPGEAIDALAPPPPAALPYTRQPELLTRAERDFFAVLRAAAPPGWHVFPQVRLANLVTPRQGVRNWTLHFNRVAAKCVDFVLCAPHDTAPLLVVELDDSSHNRPDRQARDAFVDAALGSAGLPILHVRWRPRYDAEELAAAICRAAGLPANTPLQSVPALDLPALAPIRAAPHAQLPLATFERAAPVGPRWACRRCDAEVGATAKRCPGCGTTLEL